jgi:hypothetical protein
MAELDNIKKTPIPPYDFAVDFTRKWEGGYTNNSQDFGGPTNYGVTQTTYDSYLSKKNQPKKSVKSITKPEVDEIYQGFWDDSYPSPMNIILFDTSFNVGPNSPAVFFKQMKVDPNKVKGYENNSPELLSICNKFLASRLEYHQWKAANKPGQDIFLLGWTNRVNDLKVKTVLSKPESVQVVALKDAVGLSYKAEASSPEEINKTVSGLTPERKSLIKSLFPGFIEMVAALAGLSTIVTIAMGVLSVFNTALNIAKKMPPTDPVTISSKAIAQSSVDSQKRVVQGVSSVQNKAAGTVSHGLSTVKVPVPKT